MLNMKRYWLAGLALFLLIAFPGSRAGNRDAYPLPEDRGTAGILAALEKLPVYTRVLEVTAHPDDESAGTLTWLSRKIHARTALFCPTRGEGGQNILGKEKGGELGLVRTGELLEACKYYGVELYFGIVVDFGFSKTAEETLSKWDHEKTLEEIVRFIRRWRPTVIISRFQGTAADGHGNHEAAGILTKEAFQAAADPQRFPEQIDRGLQVWQARKLYVGIGGGEMAAGAEPGSKAPAGTVRIPVGEYNPVLGRSYREIATEGYSKHRTQGNGAAFALAGRGYEYFRLLFSAASSGNFEPTAKEDSFFDSIDTSLTSIVDLAGSEKKDISFLQVNLESAKDSAMEAIDSFHASRPESSAPAIAKGIESIAGSISRIESSGISSRTRALVLDALQEKLADFRNALSAVLGIYFVARTQDLTGIPAEKEPVTTYFYNRGHEQVFLKKITVTGPGTVSEAGGDLSGALQPGGTATGKFTLEISREAKPTEQFWYLAKSQDARYEIRPTEDEFAPFGTPEIRTEAVYVYRNVEVPVVAVARAQAGDPIRGADFVEFQIVPALSLALDPELEIAPVSSSSKPHEFRVSILNNQKGESHGIVKLISKEFKVQPPEAEFRLSQKGESFTRDFTVQIPPGTKTGEYSVQAIAMVDGKEFSTGYKVISYPENWTRNYYSPSKSKIESFQIKIDPKLTIGYVPGAGDDVPAALEQLGIKVRQLSASDLAFGHLSQFSAIITGIRAYNVNADLRGNNKRLLDYVAQGGTLIVQYVRPTGRPVRGSAGVPFPFGPYPMSVSDADRITVEDSPVRILDPASPVFNKPNKITEDDFKGWVQERGLYFMNSWDPHYKPLLSGNDPGEEPKNGGMLFTHYGKGYYVYTAYAWFRQLPAGVPGAFRIFANLISLGAK
jgi:LmbE family N-acetylglucosaminyl deacetylase